MCTLVMEQILVQILVHENCLSEQIPFSVYTFEIQEEPQVLVFNMDRFTFKRSKKYAVGKPFYDVICYIHVTPLCGFPMISQLVGDRDT